MDTELQKAIADWREAKSDQEKISIKEIRDIKKRFKQACDHTKRETQKLDAQQRKPNSRTRSGKSSDRKTRRAIYSDGKWINKGIDDANDKFDQEEKDYLEKAIAKVRKVTDLKFEHLKYLVIDSFLDELKDIKSGKVKSEFHDRYMKPDGDSRTGLQAEIRTSLFTNEQRDYISGLLQGAFQTTIKDANDDIKHFEIDYVEVVMLYECIARIVQYVHDLDSVQDALKFIRKKSREALGIVDYDDDD